MQSLLPFLYGADGKFSILALLAFIGLVLFVLFVIRKVPQLRAVAAA